LILSFHHFSELCKKLGEGVDLRTAASHLNLAMLPLIKGGNLMIDINFTLENTPDADILILQGLDSAMAIIQVRINK